MTKFLVITSGKGGTGKTTIALNLGTALTLMGREVIVVDGSFSGPHIGLHLGAPSPKHHLHHVLQGKKRINEVVFLHQSGLKIIPASISMKDIEEVDLSGFERLKPEMMGMGEVIIFDSSPGFGKEALTVLKSADEIIVVTNPDLAAVTDALRIVKYARGRGIRILGVVVNKVRDEESEMAVKNIETLLEAKVIAVIPDDPNVRKALHIKHPVVYSHPSSKASIAIKKLAKDLIGEPRDERQIFKGILKRFGMDEKAS
ncbi:MAG: cell division ATPase MinD [Nanoarchaeota archaeon]|nr:cell division ATPase MinD [Nanoarchaeota archaeon]